MAHTMNRPTETPQAPTALETAPEATAGPVKATLRQPTRSRVGRRVFLVTATTAALCGVGAVAAPRVIPSLEEQAQAMGRAAILNEIGDLEGVSLDAAIRAAEVTRKAVKLLVIPLARFVAVVGVGAFALMLRVVDLVRGGAYPLGLNIAHLDALQAMALSWQRGVSALPIALDTYLTADIESAEKYLRALKQLADHPHLH